MNIAFITPSFDGPSACNIFEKIRFQKYSSHRAIGKAPMKHNRRIVRLFNEKSCSIVDC